MYIRESSVVSKERRGASIRKLINNNTDNGCSFWAYCIVHTRIHVVLHMEGGSVIVGLALFSH